MTRNLSFASQAMRLLAAASLACTVATVGCTTDRTPGAGEPQHFAPSVGPTMPSTVPGTEQNRPVNPPMISSYTAPNAVMPRHPDLDALAVAAANASFRGRYLGPADPGGVASYAVNPQAATVQTGQFINPSDSANPEITINRSISSPPTDAIIGGGGGGGGAIVVDTTGAVATTGAATSAVTLTPTTSAITALSPTAAANTTAAAATTVTNATAPVLNTRGGLLNPTISSAAMPSPTAAANRGVAISTATTVASTANTTPTTAATTSAVTTVGTGSGVLVLRNPNGGVTITNSKTGGDGTVAPATTMRAPLTLKTGNH
jgi:hypothetical protein